MMIIRLCKTVDAFQAVIDVKKGAGLVSIAPNLNFVAIPGQRDFAT
jgi:hypothetical protein